MAGTIKIVSSVMGLFVLSLYLYRGIKQKKSLQVVECIEAFLAGYGIVPGLVLPCCVFYPPLFSLLDDQHVYHAVAGIAILYLTYSGISKLLK